ncbi:MULTISPECIES: alcohol dehydrogenase catalytic domain-containing protein [unclassified Luteococcus]|uniref:alcohol dehydrogenase catalytic domain-containing protein n=1 Tax=unclassified Luteococcus TaxID=2639923 RepID=UPI00313D51C4
MRAIVEYGNRRLNLEDLPTPQIKEDEVLFQVKMAGLCMNDTRDYVGQSVYTYPRVGGHEFSGVIAEVGAAVDPSRFSVGDHVVRYIIPNCGECHYCHTGRANLCSDIYQSTTFQNPEGISGFFGFSEFLAVKACELVKFPEGVEFTTSAMTEPVACVVHSVQHAGIELGDTVLVIGGGVMGQLHLLLAKLRGARVLVSEPDEARRNLATRLGADGALDPRSGDLPECIIALTDGRGADIVFNTTASPQVAGEALACAGRGGKTYMFSSLHPNAPIPIDVGAIHSRETVIAGTVSPTVESFSRAVLLLAHGLLDVHPLIDSVFPLEEACEAFEHALQPATFKTMIDFS